MSTRSIIGVALIVPVAVVIFFIVAGSGSGPPGFREKRAEAECTKASPDCLPAVTFVDSNHEVYPPEMTKGKVIVVNFWATWCGPCKHEIPAFNRVYEQYKDRGVIFFGVLQEDASPSDILNFASDHEMTYPIVPIDDTIARQFGLANNIPTTFIYDKGGERRLDHVGGLDEDDLRRTLDQLLAE
jgi:thiol-disulfide isomerase/thioredoxin